MVSLFISKILYPVADDNFKDPPLASCTLNCSLALPSSKTIWGSVFAVVPVGYIITLGIMIICFQVR
jgi:hypothetical protein